jgi:flavin-dependent dehydrogenase
MTVESMAGKSEATVAIAGAGIAGAYLYRILKNRGQQVDLFDRRPQTRCGLSPCAWGTSKGFEELVMSSGLNPEDYLLGRFDHLLMDDVKVRGDLMTFDKPKLIEDLLQGVKIRYSPLIPGDYERVVDATGISRAFLPKIGNDIVLSCLQYRVKAEKPLPNRIRLGAIGYAWCFPLGEGEYHIGCGSLAADPRLLLEELGWLSRDLFPERKTLCRCAGEIRLAAPHYSRPFVAKDASVEIWGVGEAIGCVAPLAGDGIVPGMRSVRLLLENWNSPEGYTQAILREFQWMKKERKVIDKLRTMEDLGISDAMVLIKNSKRMGMEIGIWEAAMLMNHLK